MLSTYRTPPAASSCHPHIEPIVTPACNSAQSPTNGRCLRLGDDGRCSLVEPRLVCPFAGHGAGLCSWHGVELPVEADGATRFRRETMAARERRATEEWNPREAGRRAAEAMSKRVEVEREVKAAKPAPAPAPATPTAPTMADGRRLCRCGADLAARRRLCDACRLAARQKTWQGSQRRARRRLASAGGAASDTSRSLPGLPSR